MIRELRREFGRGLILFFEHRQQAVAACFHECGFQRRVDVRRVFQQLQLCLHFVTRLVGKQIPMRFRLALLLVFPIC